MSETLKAFHTIKEFEGNAYQMAQRIVELESRLAAYERLERAAQELRDDIASGWNLNSIRNLTQQQYSTIEYYSLVSDKDKLFALIDALAALGENKEKTNE